MYFNEDLAPSKVHIGCLQRLRAPQLEAFEERELIHRLKAQDLVAVEVTDELFEWIGWYPDNLLYVKSRLITAGMYDLVMSQMALSWLGETEHMWLDALVDEAE